jgi:hypothetical protein
LVIITNSLKFQNYFLDGNVNLFGVVLRSLVEDGYFITFDAINYPEFSNFLYNQLLSFYMDVVYFTDVTKKKLKMVEKVADGFRANPHSNHLHIGIEPQHSGDVTRTIPLFYLARTASRVLSLSLL